jgi:hypothetical protein
MKNQLFSLNETAMQLRSQRPLHVQGEACHPGSQGGEPKKNNLKKWRAEKEMHKRLLTPKKDKSQNNNTSLSHMKSNSFTYFIFPLNPLPSGIQTWNLCSTCTPRGGFSDHCATPPRQN